MKFMGQSLDPTITSAAPTPYLFCKPDTSGQLYYDYGPVDTLIPVSLNFTPVQAKKIIDKPLYMRLNNALTKVFTLRAYQAREETKPDPSIFIEH